MNFNATWWWKYQFLRIKSQNVHFATIQAQIGQRRVNCVLNLISRLFQVKMVDFKMQTSNISLFFKTILISNKNITPFDTKMAHSYRWPLLYYALRRDFLIFFFFIFRILGQNQEKVSFLVDLRCSKVTKQAFIELKV